MNSNRNSGHIMPLLTLNQKRRFLLGFSDPEIHELLSTGSENDFEKISHYAGLNADQIERMVSDPQTIKEHHLDPNRLRREQLEQVPSLVPEQIDMIMHGKPYYSLDELVSATKLTRQTVHELFEVKPYSFEDSITGRAVTLEPVFGRYIIPPSEFEADPALAVGFTDVYASSARTGLRVVEAADFEGEQHPHLLKREFKGRVYPVMRDVEGFERYLVPAAVDVWFKREVAEAKRETILKELHLQVTESAPEVGYYRTRLTLIPEDDDVIHAVLNTIGDVIQRPEVLFAEPDQLGFEDFGPDLRDEQVDEFEALEQYWNETIIELAGAHAITRGSPDVTIFIIDSGCRIDHEELELGLRSDWKNLDLSFDLGEVPEVKSPNETVVSHGTKVAGVVRKIAPGCRILPVKIPGNAGGPGAPGYGLRAAAILKTLDYLESGKHAVMNISWKTNGEHIGIREALKSAEARDLVITTSAGNYPLGAIQRPDDLHYPSAHNYYHPPINKSLLSVAALGPSDVRASYSYYGSNSISVSAPGGEHGGMGSSIYTTSTPNKNSYVAGTSFAAPHVAGLAALLFSVKPKLSAEQVINHIKNTADIVNDANANFYGQLGSGRINARAALEQVAGPATTHKITATAGTHGVVLPGGAVTVPASGSQRFEFVPDLTYFIADVLVDSVSIGTPASYTITDINADHTLAVTFAKQPAGEEHQEIININTASSAKLEALAYVGSWLANQIVSYRQSHGPYGNIWDLSAIGMSDWAIGQIANTITV